MKKLFAIIFIVFLVACGNGEETTNKTVEKKEEVDNQTTEEVEKNQSDGLLTEVGQVIKDSSYNVELLKIKDINETLEHGPLSVHLIDAKLIRMFDISNEMKEFLQQFSKEEISNEITYIQLQYTAKNNSEKDITWSKLTDLVLVNQGKQIDGLNDDFLSDEFIYDIYSGVEVEYLNGYIVPNSDVNDIRLIFSPVDELNSYNELSEKLNIT